MDSFSLSGGCRGVGGRGEGRGRFEGVGGVGGQDIYLATEDSSMAAEIKLAPGIRTAFSVSPIPATPTKAIKLSK